jgi:CheY-like chemotaxis protein
MLLREKQFVPAASSRHRIMTAYVITEDTFHMALRILVVEDHAAFRRVICTALQRRAESQIIEAADGLEAVQKAEELQPDLILLDINLPKLHGFEAAKEIRRLAPQARLLFMSQESSSDIVREALRLGAHGYMQKISAATDLLPAIDAVLDGQRFVSSSVAFPEPADAPAPRRHEILFCSDDAAIVNGLTSFIAAALNAADAAIVLVTESHRTRLLQELRTQGVDIDAALERSTCVSLDADVAPDPVRFLEAIDGVRAAAAKAGKAHPRVAFGGERAGRLWAAGRTAEAVQLEQLCGELAHDVDILCVYPVPYTNDDQALTRICAEHTTVSAASRWNVRRV